MKDQRKLLPVPCTRGTICVGSFGLALTAGKLGVGLDDTGGMVASGNVIGPMFVGRELIGKGWASVLKTTEYNIEVRGTP